MYLWQPYPSFDKEVQILRSKLPGVDERLAEQIGRVMTYLRGLPLNKLPGVAESLDWGAALMALHYEKLEPEILEKTLGCIVKDFEDWETVGARKGELERVLERT